MWGERRAAGFVVKMSELDHGELALVNSNENGYIIGIFHSLNM
jgi:hypothetical protein